MTRPEDDRWSKWQRACISALYENYNDSFWRRRFVLEEGSNWQTVAGEKAPGEWRVAPHRILARPIESYTVISGVTMGWLLRLVTEGPTGGSLSVPTVLFYFKSEGRGPDLRKWRGPRMAALRLWRWWGQREYRGYRGNTAGMGDGLHGNTVGTGISLTVTPWVYETIIQQTAVLRLRSYSFHNCR